MTDEPTNVETSEEYRNAYHNGYLQGLQDGRTAVFNQMEQFLAVANKDDRKASDVGGMLKAWEF